MHAKDFHIAWHKVGHSPEESFNGLHVCACIRNSFCFDGRLWKMTALAQHKYSRGKNQFELHFNELITSIQRYTYNSWWTTHLQIGLAYVNFPLSRSQTCNIEIANAEMKKGSTAHNVYILMIGRYRKLCSMQSLNKFYFHFCLMRFLFVQVFPRKN